MIHGGALAWIGTTVSGMDSRAEYVVIGDTPAAAAPDIIELAVPGQPAAGATRRCPADMVDIGGQYCIDRYENHLVDEHGVALAPDYPSTPGLTKVIWKRWLPKRWRSGGLSAQAMPLPPLLRAVSAAPRVKPRSRPGAIPSGYVTGHVAKDACEAVGKRLCSKYEWVGACRGENDTRFPYGDDYQHNVCNVFRYAHPALALHKNPSVGHLDPRLNRVRDRGEVMLRRTGATSRCASRWGDDAVYDMVGNLDEWVQTKSGGFAGGFYSRATKKGCDAIITVHPRRYLDYSLGIRCCSDG